MGNAGEAVSDVLMHRVVIGITPICMYSDDETLDKYDASVRCTITELNRLEHTICIPHKSSTRKITLSCLENKDVAIPETTIDRCRIFLVFGITMAIINVGKSMRAHFVDCLPTRVNE